MAGTPKFFASMLDGVCANQSVTSNVLNSDARPSSNEELATGEAAGAGSQQATSCNIDHE